MSVVDSTHLEVLARRPKRADALRNYEALIAAAREAFAEGGTSTSLEEIARRAGVGIGTLYRNFPSRQDLLEAVYVGEVEALCQSAEELSGREPWDGLVEWLHGFIGYMATKQALAGALLDYLDPGSDFFRGCRGAFFAAGEPLLLRAQEAGVVRQDTNIGEVIQMVSGISKIPSGDPEQIGHILDMAIDGLRYRS
ncbi:MAG TPA: helix-turn-helix domain-containing protein [Solirubrobacteraceae bacterium]|jgi:AcrR family transcriptional regulator